MNFIENIVNNPTLSLRGYRNGGQPDELSREDLLEKVNHLRAWFRAEGCTKGDKVVLITTATTDAVVVILSCFSLGLVVVPLSPQASLDAYQKVVFKYQPRCVVIDQDPGREVVKHLQATVPHILASDFVSSLYISVGLKLADILLPSSSMNGSRIEFLSGESFDKNSKALIIYSSGSSGRAKTICYTLGNLDTFLSYHDVIYHQYFNSDSRPLSPLLSVFPFSHLAGIAVALQGLRMSSPTILLAQFDPGLLCKYIISQKVEFISLVASMYPSLISEVEGFDKSRFESVKFCISLGESTSPSLLKKIARVFNAQSISAYGLTECLPGLAHRKANLNAKNTPLNSCGKHLFGELKLVDELGDENAEQGVLWIRNSTVFHCYEDEGLNKENIEDEWFKTKDIFYKDEQGFYYHKGRADDVFSSKGKNIFPREVEALVLDNASVKKACCMAIKDANDHNVPGLIVEGDTISEAELMISIIKLGESHLVPKVLLCVRNLPKSGPGKIDRQSCQKMLQKSLAMKRSSHAEGESCKE